MGYFWINNWLTFLIIIKKLRWNQSFVFCFCYLNAVDLTPVTHVERVHNKQEDNGFEDGLASVSENECHEYELRAHKKEEFGGGDPEYEKPNDADE